jgi:hypothetical protein
MKANIVEKLKFKQNDLVKFDLKNGVSGIGEVLGLSHASMPIIGVGYIIRVVHNTGTVSIPNEVYPFTHITCSEVFMECSQ